jgi:hypothetical protein
MRIGSLDRLTRFIDEVVRLMRAWFDEVRDVVVASREGLEPRHRTTLDIGCWLVVATLGLGLQLGGWSVWSVLVAAAGYVIWVLAYSEATVQAIRRQRAELMPRLPVSD